MSEAVHADSASSGTADRILSILYDATVPFVSGEELSRTLAISRSAVWKQIKALRALGFKIIAEPSEGTNLFRLLTGFTLRP